MPADFEKSFVELVQLHEREWGTELYPSRPSLVDLLNAPIVVVWTAPQPLGAQQRAPRLRQPAESHTPSRFTLSVHRRLEELDPIILAMVVAGKAAAFSNRKLLYLFVEKHPVKVLGVRLLLESVT